MLGSIMKMVQVARVRLSRQNRLVTSFVVSCSFFFLEKEARAQDVSNSIQAPGADGISSDAIASFSGAATGQKETAPAPAGSINAVTAAGNPETEAEHNHIEDMRAETSKTSSETVSGGENDLTQGTSYKRYFGANATPLSSTLVIDPDDPRNGPTYQKYFLPVGDRSPRQKRRIRRGGPLAHPEHFGVSGHRRHHEENNFEESHNAETIIGRKTLEHFVEGTNALQALAASTPGANFSSSDASGLDPTANSFYLRGYDKSQLGFTMDGIPMGNQAFGGSSGADVSQILIQENIAGVAASQGAGGLDTPSSTTLGGTVTYTTLDPSDKFGVKISQQFSSFSGYRTFGRLDSGKLNPTGTKFTVSFLRNAQNLWTNYYNQPWGTQGRGFQREENVNFKFVQPVSDFGKITVQSLWVDSPQYNQAQVNPGMKKDLGYGISNLYPNYGAANRWGAYGGGCDPSKGEGFTPSSAYGGASACDASNLAYQGSQVQRNYLESLRGDFQISPVIKTSTLVYGQVADNRMGGVNPGFVSPASVGTGDTGGYVGPGTAAGGNPYMNESDQHLKGRRLGVTQNFDFQLGHRNALKTGVWYENNRYNQPTLFYGFGGGGAFDGSGYAIPNDFNLQNKDGFEAFHQTFTTNTFQFYIEDGFQMAKNMKFTYGFKSLVQSTNGGMNSRASDNDIRAWGAEGPASYAYRPSYGRLTSSNAFLPHFNYDWKFLPKHEFYFDVAENMEPIGTGAWTTGLGNGKDLNSAQAAFNQEKKNLRGERTWNYVVGYRYAGGKLFNLGIDYYHTDYIGRLGTISQSATIAGASTASVSYQSLGNEKMDGADIGGTAHLSRLFRVPDSLGQLDFTNSFSYNHAVYEPNNPALSAIKGQQQVLYPRYMYKTNVNYTNGRLGWNLNVNYNSQTNITYSGDVKNPGYWASQFTGYLMLGPRGKESRAKLTFGVSNLFGQHYTVPGYASIPLNGSAGPDGLSPTLTWAAPREFFGSVNIGF
ncbi:TonB-dependent receptor [Acetobacteraceae bacterium]|nr:TonB-dependent receptor [Acetobacteraceae bacterium]